MSSDGEFDDVYAARELRGQLVGEHRRQRRLAESTRSVQRDDRMIHQQRRDRRGVVRSADQLLETPHPPILANRGGHAGTRGRNPPDRIQTAGNHRYVK
jgi:hypothetical protein